MLGLPLSEFSSKDMWVIAPLVIESTLLSQLAATDQVDAENPVGWERLRELICT